MKLVVREARPDDGEAVSRIYAPYVVETPYTFEEQVPDAREMSQRIDDILTKYPYLIAELDGRVVGYAYGTAFRPRASYRWSVEIAVYLDKTCHRRGLGRTMCNILFPLLQAQRFAVVYASITIPNPPSIGLFESLGFVRNGIFHAVGFKLGAWHDVGYWEKQLITLPTHPSEPIPWPEMPRFQPVTHEI